MVYPHAAPHYRPTLGGALALAGAVMQVFSPIHWRTQVLWAFPQGHLSVQLSPSLLV